MKYPEKIDDSDEDNKLHVKRKQKPPAAGQQQAKWLKTQDPDVNDKSATATPVAAYAFKLALQLS